MKQPKLVSVVVLSYCNIEGIYETVNSILKQTYGSIEIIISDDATPNFAYEQKKIEKYIEENKSNNVKSVVFNAHTQNVGIVRNINSALKLAKGTYVKAIGAEDCLTDENVLQEYVEFLEERDELICFAKLRGICPDGTIKEKLASCESDYNKLQGKTPEYIKNRLFARNFLPAPAWFAKRQLFEEYGYFKEETKYIEDYGYWCYLARVGVQFAFLDKVLIDYKLSGISSKGVYSERFMNDMFIIYDKFIFPYDKRFGCMQGVYNYIKRAGLNFYMSKARWKQLTIIEKIKCRIKYAPFYVYTWMLDVKTEISNRK